MSILSLVWVSTRPALKDVGNALLLRARSWRAPAMASECHGGELRSNEHLTCDKHRERSIHEVWRRKCTISVSITKLPYSSRLCNHGRQDLSSLEARNTGKPVAQSSRRPAAVTWTSEYKVYHTQPFKKKTMFAGKQSGN